MLKKIVLVFILNGIMLVGINAKSFYTIETDTTSTHQSSMHSDSSKNKKYIILSSTLAASFTENKNWQTLDYKNYSFLGNVDYALKKSSAKLKHLYQIRSELGFLKFVDSTWYKNSDNLNVLAQWTEYSTNTLTHSYSIIFKSQFTDSWKYSSDVGGKPIREWRGGLLDPFTLLIAYGLDIDFWKRCFANISFATIKINVRPRYDDVLLPTEKELARTKKCFIMSEYGMSIQSGISKKIHENFMWDNKTQFFANGINKDQVTFDFENRFKMIFLKYAQFRLDTHFVYDPLYSCRLQYKQEFFCGILLEIEKEK